MKVNIDDLLDLPSDKKIHNNVRVAYQTGINVKLKEGVEAIAYPYTFEDALALSNVDLFKKENLKGLALVTNFKKIIETSKTIEDCCKDMYDTLTSNKKLLLPSIFSISNNLKNLKLLLISKKDWYG